MKEIKQTLIVGVDYTEEPPKITATVYPEEVEIVLTQEKLRLLEVLNEQGVLHLVKTAIKKTEDQFSFQF